MDSEYFDNLNDGSIYKADLDIASKYEISYFEPESLLTRNGLMTITAMTGAGKTVFIIDALSKIHKEYDEIIMISRTAKLQKCYDFIERSLIYDHFDEKQIENLWNDRVAKYESKIKIPRTLIIMDDLINDKNFKRSLALDDLITGGRHLGINVWILTQNFTSLKPLIRNNASWAVAFDIDSSNERKHFVNQYLCAKNSHVGDILFKRIVKEAPFQCLVVEIHKNGANTTEKIKKYIADPKPKKFLIKDTRKNPLGPLINKTINRIRD